MTASSLIAQFAVTLKRVKRTADQYQDLLRHNEAQTRQVLINPILEALGWEQMNPDMVRFELNHNGTRIDYGLLDSQGKTKIIVEAKSLGTNLYHPPHINTAIGYALAHGVSNVWLTDGLAWHYYNNFQPGQIQPDVINVCNHSLLDCALFLINNLDAYKYWAEGVFDENIPVFTVTHKHDPIDKKMVSTPPVSLTDAEPEVTFSVRQHRKETSLHVVEDEFIPLSALPFDLKGKKPPKKLRLPDGSINHIRYWRQVLSESIKYVLKKNPRLPIPLPDCAGGDINLLSGTRPNQNVTILEWDYNGRRVYSYVNYSATDCVRNAIHILKYLPADQKKLETAVMF